MSIILVDEQGPIEVDARILTLLLHDTFQMATAYSVQHESPGPNKAIVRKTNVILKQTWGNDAWMKNYLNHLYRIAREGQQASKPAPHAKNCQCGFCQFAHNGE